VRRLVSASAVARRVRHWRQAGRPAQTLLHTADRRVDRPVVEAHRAPAQTEHRVDHEQAARIAAGAANLVERLQDAGRRIGVHDRHHLRPGPTDGVDHRTRLDALAPFGVDTLDARAVASRERTQQFAEVSVDADQHGIVRREQAAEDRVDARARCARHRERRRRL
jgi:hypothetical protein